MSGYRVYVCVRVRESRCVGWSVCRCVGVSVCRLFGETGTRLFGWFPFVWFCGVSRHSMSGVSVGRLDGVYQVAR